MMSPTIHTPQDFKRAYKDRDWRFYKGLLATCIRYGEPGKILDLGAGLGLFVECCMRYGIECVGIEGSSWACKKAEERGIKLICLDLAEDFPFPDEEFSVVVCNQVIEHLLPQTAKHMLQESYRVLKPNGVIIINSPCYYNSRERCEPTHINLYTPSRLRREVEEAGFKIIAEPNSPRPLLGTNPLSLVIMEVIFRLVKFDFLSNTANCIARKELELS